MGRKKINFKVGDTMTFRFAGSEESGKVVRVEGDKKNKMYWVYDGKYTYPVRQEAII